MGSTTSTRRLLSTRKSTPSGPYAIGSSGRRSHRSALGKIRGLSGLWRHRSAWTSHFWATEGLLSGAYAPGIIPDSRASVYGTPQQQLVPQSSPHGQIGTKHQCEYDHGRGNRILGEQGAITKGAWYTLLIGRVVCSLLVTYGAYWLTSDGPLWSVLLMYSVVTALLFTFVPGSPYSYESYLRSVHRHRSGSSE